MAKRIKDEAAIQQAGGAYMRNIAVVEAAVLRGQFNVAKVLRAAAHAQRALAVDQARRTYADAGSAEVLAAVAGEFRRFKTTGRATNIRSQILGIVDRALASLSSNPDVLESDVAQSLWGCRICGFIAEGDQPDACEVCGALAPEFDWFGPFFGGTTRIGTLLPVETIDTLGSVATEVEEVLADVSEAVAGRKPGVAEWSIKETLAHMLETDLLFAMRVRFILDPALTGSIPRPMPPWKLHEGKGYESMTTAALVRQYRDVRNETLKLVKGLSSTDWATGKSGTTVVELGTWLAQHEIGHAQQLRRLSGQPLKAQPPRLRTA